MSIRLGTETCLVYLGVNHASPTTDPVNINSLRVSNEAAQLYSNTHTLILTNNETNAWYFQFLPLGIVPTNLTPATGALYLPPSGILTLGIGAASSRPGGDIPWFQYTNASAASGQVFVEQVLGFNI